MYAESLDYSDSGGQRPSCQRPPGPAAPRTSLDHRTTSPAFDGLPFAAILFDESATVIACNRAAVRDAALPAGAAGSRSLVPGVLTAREFDRVLPALQRRGRGRGNVRFRGARRVRVSISTFDIEAGPRYLAVAAPAAGVLFGNGAQLVAVDVVRDVNSILAVVSLRAALAERPRDDPDEPALVLAVRLPVAPP